MSTDAETVVPAEERLIAMLRQYAAVYDGNGDRPGWAYRSVPHLLLEQGRLFTPAPRAGDVPALPASLCYANAAMIARAYDGLIYAEGVALLADQPVQLEHAWCVQPDGTVADPTWDDGAAAAYLGLPITDVRLWPIDGQALLADFARFRPLLENGLPDGALARIGRPLT